MGKGRPSILIDKAELEAAIAEVEKTNTFPSVLALCDAVAKTAWASTVKLSSGKPANISGQNVYFSIRKFGITVNTKKVEKKEINTLARRGKSLDTEYLKLWQARVRGLCIRESSKAKLHRLVQKAAAGNKRAIVKLNCMECVGYEDTQSIGGESCNNCPLVAFWRK